MFEHMKNYQAVMHKVRNLPRLFCTLPALSVPPSHHSPIYTYVYLQVASFLKPGGKLFVHIFTHANTAYHFDKGWMAETFFSGGTMPSEDLLLYFQVRKATPTRTHGWIKPPTPHHYTQDDLKVEAQWTIDGKHYSKTNAAWLANLDAKATEARVILNRIYGDQEETKAFVGWRLFFLTLIECFAMDDGTQWTVSLYRFVKPQ